MAKTIAPKNNLKTTGKSLFEKFEIWAESKEKILLYIFLVSSLLFSVLLFNARISEANDDALYMEGGWRYVNEFPNYFYTQNAPLYVMLLALMTKLFGFKLLIFKILNVLFTLFAVFLFFKAFVKRIPYAVFIPVMFFISCNFMVQYYASMTFTEAFYLFLQAMLFFWFFKLYDALQLIPKPNLHWKLWLMLGFIAFCMSTTKSAGIVVVPALLLYFCTVKQFKNALYALCSYAIYKVLYEVIVRLVWGKQNQFAAQAKTLTQKDPYDAAAGSEDFSGFVSRVVDNCNLYFSKRFFQILGFREENSVEIYGLLTLLVIGLCVAGLYFTFKFKNRPLYFFGLFTGAQLLLSFIILAARWDQPRIIMICMPILLMLIFSFFYKTFQKSGMAQNLYFVLIAVVCFSLLVSSLRRSSKNFSIVSKNLKGDIYYGYTPDWQNFLKCSRWCADSLPENTLVVSRKAPMSFVYSNGKKFFPIYNVIKKDSLTNQSNPDSALAFFKAKGVTHVMLGSLRIDPTANSGQIINTIHNVIQPIMEKYPNKLKLIHTEGSSEESYILEITK